MEDNRIELTNYSTDDYSVFRTIRELPTGDKYSDGISLVHKATGTEYELLECKSYDPVNTNKYKLSTSDIVVIFEVCENGYKRLINYSFGANDFNSLIIYAMEYINDFLAGTRMDLQHELQID